jgi:hypothetical protein
LTFQPVVKFRAFEIYRAAEEKLELKLRRRHYKLTVLFTGTECDALTKTFVKGPRGWAGGGSFIERRKLLETSERTAAFGLCFWRVAGGRKKARMPPEKDPEIIYRFLKRKRLLADGSSGRFYLR